MKHKTLAKGVIALSVLTSSILYATNGDALIGIGIKTRGMGGAGIAYGQGAESALLNPALITDIAGNEISFGATIFMPDIKTSIGGAPQSTSEADISMIPEVSLAHNLGNGYYIGYGMWGTAGMGVDFKNTPSAMNMNTQLQLMQLAIPMAYKAGGLSIAIAPVVQYGSLDINYQQPGNLKVGDGVSSDFGYGFNIGATYGLDNGFNIGAVYKSAIEMEYATQLTNAATPFGIALPDGDHLDQPAEYGIGISYSSNGHSIAIDYKRIAWSDAAGYREFKWEDQDVFAVGYQYARDNWALRLGYNHATSPISEQLNPAINVFNLLGFPATAEDHYSMGGSYTFSESFTADIAVVYSPKSEKSFNITGLGIPGNNLIVNKHTETSISMQVTYKF